ncbi:hypothetical protein RsS62_51780 [Rhizobium dioscoreae]|uniref:Mobile element protein n=1 Tax=Rhizobium dioscoreae TaxID=2653122 RepID=A0ABQ0ZDK5_9HYPH|nr:hypothetical protein RsS62_51780 [Rhizobium dioscoreae]GES53670.1 hypothetical protein RsS93_62840 [Rhizobium dioscoreae]GLU85131.1 hypothetical protein Rhsp01_63070 [Rhizobium sp. NBRC 114257]
MARAFHDGDEVRAAVRLITKVRIRAEYPDPYLAVIMRRRPALARPSARQEDDAASRCGKNWDRGRIGVKSRSQQGFGTCSKYHTHTTRLRTY